MTAFHVPSSSRMSSVTVRFGLAKPSWYRWNCASPDARLPVYHVVRAIAPIDAIGTDGVGARIDLRADIQRQCFAFVEVVVRRR